MKNPCRDCPDHKTGCRSACFAWQIYEIIAKRGYERTCRRQQTNSDYRAVAVARKKNRKGKKK